MSGWMELLLVTLTLIIPGVITKLNNVKHKNMNYVLLWSKELTQPFETMNRGQNIFVEKMCKYQNCYVTNDELYFQDVIDFDAIVFVGSKITETTIVPHKRSDDQLYVFAARESANNHPMDADFNWFFNITWTYRLDSDVTFEYIAVRNVTGEILGPQREMHWADLKKIITVDDDYDYMMDKINKKNTAVMWIHDNCNLNAAESASKEYAKELENQMLHYGLKFDFYGKCGNRMCINMTECLAKLETDYYFYFAAENSMAVDYVTNTLLYPLQNFAVPIVYGGANYSRFLPEGSYIDAKALTAEELALQINQIIMGKETYHDFFKWQKLYTFDSAQDNPDTDGYCAFCAMLNNEQKRNERKVYAYFSKWWNEQPYETDKLMSSLEPAAIVTYSPANRNSKKIIINNPDVLTSRYEAKTEAGFFGFIADLIHYYFDVEI